MHPRGSLRLALLALFLAAVACGGSSSPPPDGGEVPVPPDDRLFLHDGWAIQSSAQITASGAELSTPGYDASGWTATTVPSTVLAALVAAGVYPDPYVGDALASIPQTPFDVSWWYRVEFTLPDDFDGQTAWLDLEGINYRANVWLNGQLVAGSDRVAGTFTSHEWDVTALVHAGTPNALAIEIIPPDLDADLTLSWRDWNPAPPDRDMGIWQDVYLAHSGPVAVRGARVRSHVDPSLGSAELTVAAEVVSTSAQPAHVRLRARFGAVDVAQEIDLAAGETRTVELAPATYPALHLSDPVLWWPAQLGTPALHDLLVTAEVDGHESDHEAVRFGIREVSFELLEGHDDVRLFRVNGKPILIRGGGWASDMMLRPASPERLDAELRYVLDLGLNTIRLEGKLESDELYARADELGLLLMPGWMCCDRWEHWEDWTDDDRRIAAASMDSQARRLRNHPSVIAFLIGSDYAPPPDVEAAYLQALRGNDWPDPILPSAGGDGTASLGASGVKMTGPYDWVAPSYWYLDVDRGGAFGFNTETGPGPSVPERESLEAMLTPAQLDALWSAPDARQLHAGAEDTAFDNLGLFNAALAARLGAPTGLDDYVAKAQLMNYEAERAEYEAYSRNKYDTATGVIHWLLNNAWPSLIWHLYGYDLAPAGGYFGAKKANEPVHIQYSYDDQSVVVVNQTPQAQSGLKASVHVYDLDGNDLFHSDVTVEVGADAVARVATIPQLGTLSAVYFVALTLTRDGTLESANVYWLSRKAEIIDFEHADWFHAATLQFGDLTALSALASTPVTASVVVETDGAQGAVRVTLDNPSPAIAFFIRLKLTRGHRDEPVLPVFWSDNYVSLMPHERREVVVTYDASALGGTAPSIELRGWNVPAQVLDP